MSFTDLPDNGTNDTSTEQPAAQPAPPVNQGAPNNQQPNPAQANPVQNQPAQPQPTPAQTHAGIFHSILATLAGGEPVQRTVNPDGSVTQTKRPMSKVSLGQSILAGALSGMLGGLAAPSATDQFGHQDLSPSAAAGLAAGKANTPQARQDVSNAADDQARLQQYATTQHNLNLHAAILGNTKLQGEVMTQGLEADAPIIDTMTKSNPSAILKQGVSEADLSKMMADGSAHVTRNSVLRDGVTDVYDASGRQVMNDDGTPKTSFTYTLFDPSQTVQLTDELKKDGAFSDVPAGTSVPLRVLAKMSLDKTQMQNAVGFTKQWNDMSKSFNKDFKPVDIRAAIKSDPYLKQIVPMLGRYAGLEPDEILNKMEADKVDPNLIGRFANLFQVDRNAWAQKRKLAEKKQMDQQAADQAAAVENAKKNTPSGQLETKIKNADLEEKNLEIQKKHQEIAANAVSAIADTPVNLVGGVDVDYLKKLEPGLAAQVRAIGEGRVPLPPNRSKTGNAIAQAVTRAYPDYDSTKSSAYAATRKDFTSGKTSQGIAAINTALSHLGRTYDHAGYLSTLPGVSGIARTFGNDNATGLNTDKGAVSEEIGKAYKAGVVSQGEHDAWLKLLNTSTPQELKGNLRELAGLLKGKLDSTANQWINGMPRGAVTPVRIVSPEARAAFEKVTGSKLGPTLGDVQTTPDGTKYVFNGEEYVKRQF